jgi:hypothetical protein
MKIKSANQKGETMKSSVTTDTRLRLTARILRLSPAAALSCLALLGTTLWSQENYWTLSGNYLTAPAGVNVGIGTTTPQRNLDIYSNGAAGIQLVSTTAPVRSGCGSAR